MMLEIPKVLSSEQLARVAKMLAGAKFVDGKLSAGSRAGTVKHNEELDPSNADTDTLNELVVGNLFRHPIFQSAVLPARLSSAFFVRYSPGMTYGDHIDDPLMGPTIGKGNRYRSDVAITIFLNDPHSYDGGELEVRSAFGEQAVKLAAGNALAYPASSLHRVREVSRGERLVAVAWAQSLVRDPAKRELLYELDVARQALMRVTPKAEITQNIDRVYANLMRMWAEP
jgi:PKHD-type hydroxylase